MVKNRFREFVFFCPLRTTMIYFNGVQRDGEHHEEHEDYLQERRWSIDWYRCNDCIYCINFGCCSSIYNHYQDRRRTTAAC